MNERRIFTRRNGTALAAALLILAALTAARLTDNGFVTGLRNLTFDTFQRIKPREPFDSPVRIVVIDEPSLKTYGQWPWPRTRLAELTTRIAGMGAATIAFDIMFAEADRTSPSVYAAEIADTPAGQGAELQALLKRLPDHDEVFAASVEGAPVVLGFSIASEANEARPPPKAGFALAGRDPKNLVAPVVGTTRPLASLAERAKGIGSVSLNERDWSGVVRRIPLLFADDERLYPSLMLEALRVAQQQQSFVIRSTGASGEVEAGRPAIVAVKAGDFEIPVTQNGEFWVHYAYDRADRYVSVQDLLDPAQEDRIRPLIEGHIVFVGASAAGLLDARATALGETVPGVSIHAQAAEQVISGQFLNRPDWASGLETLATLALGLLVCLTILMVGPRLALSVGALSAALAIGLSWLAFSSYGLLLDPLYPAFAALVVHLGVTGVLYVSSDAERRFVRRAFGQYLAPQLLAKLEASPGSMKLGGEMRDLTIMFMDVRGFTPISEALSPTELVQFLNDLLAPLSDAIQAQDGTIDKYIGDSIMAFWNAPVDVPDHGMRACRAALRMRELVQQLNDADAFGFGRSGHGDLKVRIGIGINTGDACVGNMGSLRRFNYSVVGDAVNTAARIEASCKDLGAEILVSAETALRAKGLAFLEAGATMLKGKAKPAMLYALVGDENVAASGHFQHWSELHADMLVALERRDHLAALGAIEACRTAAGPAFLPLYDHFAREADMIAKAPARRQISTAT